MKKILKGVIFMALFLFIIAAGIFLYSLFIEPSRLDIQRITVKSPKIEETVKLVAFADTHIGMGAMDAKRIAKIMDKIAAEKPDIVVFLGDLFENYKNYTGGEEDELARLFSLPGLENCQKFAVLGNHDQNSKAKQAFYSIMERASYTVLQNQNVSLGNLNIIGLKDAIFDLPDTDGLVQEGDFNLLLIHEGDFGAKVTGIDLQLSGHTHGGQVRLPFIKPFILPKEGRLFLRGMYQKADGGQLYVTKGLGNSTLPLRFGAVPELTVITLEKGES